MPKATSKGSTDVPQILTRQIKLIHAVVLNHFSTNGKLCNGGCVCALASVQSKQRRNGRMEKSL